MTRPRSITLAPVRCHLCGDEIPRTGDRGRPYEYCGKPCTPQLAKSPAARELVARLRARIGELEHALDIDAEVERASNALRVAHEAGPKGELGIAVRRLANATGRDETIVALNRVAAVCKAWSRNLARTGADRIGERVA